MMNREEPWWEKYKVDVPEGQSGSWAVERFSINVAEASLHQLRSFLNGIGRRGVLPGTYTRLVHHTNFGITVVMSDTPAEILDHLEVIGRATGQVLLNGLGLGVVLRACLLKDKVEHVTVIEVAPEVVELVEPHWRSQFGDRFTVHIADALTWEPPKGVRYDVIWHDIFESICSDNMPVMTQLKRRYGKRCNWQGCWAGYEHHEHKRRGL